MAIGDFPWLHGKIGLPEISRVPSIWHIERDETMANVPRLPSTIIEMTENGYLIRVHDGVPGAVGKTYVATTLTGLMKVLKQATVEARLCGNGGKS